MNAPFVVAQANPTGTAAHSTPIRVIKVIKPQGDQAVTIQLGYDQKYKLDLTAVANEKITLVHIGEKLIILFDNKSTVTVEPFFDSMNAPLPNVSVEAAGRDFSSTEFASTFPITTDQSVLTAAGIAAAQGTPASGANFRGSAVDPLDTPDPLDLLGQEELPNFVIGPQFGIQSIESFIPASLAGAIAGAVNESGLPSTSIGTFGNNPGAPIAFTGDDSNGQSLMGTVAWGSAGPGAVPFQFTVATGGSLAGLGMFTHDAGGTVIQVDTASVSGDTLTAYAGGLGGIAVFTLTLNVDGSWTFEQLAPINHSPFGDDIATDNQFDLSGLIKAVTGDGTALTLAPNTFLLTITDDVPVLSPGFEEGEFQFTPVVTGLVNEGGLTSTAIGTVGNDPGADTAASGGPGSLYSLVSFGADGPHATAPFQFAVVDGGDLTSLGMTTPDGLGGVLPVDTASISGDTLTAYAGGLGGIAVFTLSIHGDASWEFTQLAPINHAPFGDNANNGNTFDLSILIKAVDYDGDTVPLVENFMIAVVDDAPEANDDEDSVAAQGPLTADGNVVTGVGGSDANATDGVADAPGADGFGSIAWMNASNGAVAGVYGTLTVDAGGNYSYALDSANATVVGLSEGESISESFTYTIADTDGDSAVSFLNVIIHGANVAPVAVSDTNWTQEDAALVATGNVLENLDHAGAPAGTFADQADTDPNLADILTVTAVDGGSVGSPLAGTYGSVTINSDGTYTYTLDNAAANVRALTQGQSATDTFTYTVSDGNGGTAVANLVITIFGTDNGVIITGLTPAAQGGDAVVDEADLAHGSTPDAGTLTQTGTFSVSAPDGLDDLTVGGHAVITDGVFVPSSFATPLGNTLAFTGFNPATGEVTYTYTLTDDETHAAGGGANNLLEDLAVVLTDVDGSTANDILSIRIIDDLPTAADLNATDMLDDEGLAGGIAGNGSSAGDIAGEPTGTAGSLGYTIGADGLQSLVLSGPATLGSESVTSTWNGLTNTLTISSARGDIVTVAVTDLSTGAYTVTLHKPVMHAAGDNENDATLLVNYTLTDNDGDTANGSLNIAIDDDTPTIVANLEAGSAILYDNDFSVNDLEGAALLNIAGAAGAGISGGQLVLTQELQDQMNWVAIDAGASFSGDFRATFDLLISDSGSFERADGVSFQVGNDLNTNGPDLGVFAEEPAVSGLAVTFDTWDNGGADVVKEVALWFGGVKMASVVLATLHTASPVPVAVEMQGTLVTVTYNGAVIFDHIDVGGTLPSDSNFYFGARTGFAADLHAVDNVKITIPAAPLSVDETTLGTDASMNFAGAFTASFGADGPGGIQYALSINGGDGTDSGLVDTLTGDPVTLHMNGGNVEGRNGDGDVVFVIAIDAAANVTLDQQRAVMHGVGTNPDASDPVAIDANLVMLTATVTDADGDSASQGFDLGTMVRFLDDGPAAANDIDSVPNASNTATGNVITGADTTSGAAGADSLGADGAKIAGVASVNVPANTDTTPASGDFEVDGQYGSLVLNEDGSYTYTRNPGTPGNVTDVFTYTLRDADGDTSTATLSIELSDTGVSITNLTPQAQGGDVSVNEDDLLASRGAGESEGSDLTKESTTQTGTFNISAPDGVDDLTVGGHAVITDGIFAPSSFTTPLGNTLAFTAFNPATGEVTYTYTLLDNENHPSLQGANSLFENFAVVLTDVDGSSANDTLSINIVDDVPSAANHLATAPEGGGIGTIDVVFIVDVSGSMSGFGAGVGFDVPGFSDDRIGLARYAMQQLLLNHPEIQNVQFTRFSDTANTQVWMSRAAALTFINTNGNWSTGGTTNYDAALNSEMSAYNASARPLAQGDQTVVYFLSDGEPNQPSSNPGITSDGSGSNVSIAEWETFVSAPGNDITNVFAIGIGSGVGSAQVSNLEPIAYPNTDTTAPIGDEDNVVIVSSGNLTALAQTLDDLLSAVISSSGNILTDGGITPGFGADGGRILWIEIDGTVYTWNGLTGAASVITQTGAINGTINGTTSVTAASELGGELTFYFAADGTHSAGDWSYVSPTSVAADSHDLFPYAIIDNDGDTSSAILDITVTNVNVAPPVITSNGGGTTASVSVSENTTAVTTVTSTDADGPAPTYLIVGGADAARFTINPTTGVLTFVAAPNFEAATDADTNNTYVVQVQASDGSLIDTQTITITVQDVNEQPSAGPDQVVSAAENINTSTVIATVPGTDPDLGGGNDGANNFENLSYSIVAGNAAGLFEINSSGQISLDSGEALDFETAQQHVLTVRVTDGQGQFDEVQVTVDVTNVNELVVNPENVITNFGTNAAFSVPEWAFLANDFDPEGSAIDISGASNVSGLSVGHSGGTGTNGTISITDTGSSGGTLQYTVSDGTMSTSVNVSVSQDSNSINGTSSDDILVGDNDGDTFNGNGGNDVIFAGGGNDTLVGGTGRDIMVGGSGNDTFDFNATNESGNTIATADVIADFAPGQDRIDLSSIDANTASGGNQAFTWGGTTPTANGIWFTESGGNTVISIDTNGNTASVEMMIVLTGIGLGLAASDFVL